MKDMSIPKDLIRAYNVYMESEPWKRISLKRISMDRRMCQVCSETKHLVVHHRHYRSFGNELITDLITLCGGCHDAVHRESRKRFETRRSHIVQWMLENNIDFNDHVFEVKGNVTILMPSEVPEKYAHEFIEECKNFASIGRTPDEVKGWTMEVRLLAPLESCGNLQQEMTFGPKTTYIGVD